MKKYFPTIGEVIIVNNYNEIPEGDFGIDYAGTTEDDDLYPNYNLYHIVNNGEIIVYACK